MPMPAAFEPARDFIATPAPIACTKRRRVKRSILAKYHPRAFDRDETALWMPPHRPRFLLSPHPIGSSAPLAAKCSRDGKLLWIGVRLRYRRWDARAILCNPESFARAGRTAHPKIRALSALPPTVPVLRLLAPGHPQDALEKPGWHFLAS